MPARTSSTGMPDGAGGVDVRPDQPRPHGSLVVRGVALGRRAAVVRLVARVVGESERRPSGVSSERRHTSTAARAALRVSGRSRQRHGEQLVRPHRCVVPAGPVDHVEQIRRRPGGRTVRRTTPRPASRSARPRRCRALGDVERAEPERVDLDRLARALRDRHAVDARVHPRQRPAVGALAQQPVGRVDADPVTRPVDVVLDDLLQHRRELVPELVVAGDGRRDGRPRGRTRACRRRCCTRASRCRPCSRASPRTRSPPTCAAPRGPRPRGWSRGRGLRRRSSGRATTRRTTGSRRPRSGGRRW